MLFCLVLDFSLLLGNMMTSGYIMHNLSFVALKNILFYCPEIKMIQFTRCYGSTTGHFNLFVGCC